MSVEFIHAEMCVKCHNENSFRVRRTMRLPGLVRRYKKCAQCGHKKVVIMRNARLNPQLALQN